jgi:PleD family two-component response regulator
MGVLSLSEISQMLFSSASILVIDDDPLLGQALQTVLEREGYRVTLCATGTEGLHRLVDGEQFDLLLLDVILPGMDGWGVLARLRAAPVTAQIPIIMLTAMTDEHDEIELLAAGADDYIAKPFSFDKLMAHIKAICRRSALQSINPLTGLPGNRQVERFLRQCTRERENFWAAAYVDIDNFKAYNDCYGFLRGDEVLRATAELLTTAAGSCEHDIFVGNIGGDDFIMGFTRKVPRRDQAALKEVRCVLERAAGGFDQMVKNFYDPEDVARGYLEAQSRRGGTEQYPLMAISVAVVTNTRRLFDHPLEISNTFASVKHKAKSIAGSAICFDQRRG